MNSLRKIFPLFLLFFLLLSGCQLVPQSPTLITGTPWPTFTPLPSSTPLPTATLTPTPYVAGLAGTAAAPSTAVINAGNLKRLAQLNRLGQGLPQALAWSPDGLLMAVASTRGLSLYEGESLALRRTTDIRAGARSLDFFADGTFVLSGNGDGSLSLWETATGQRAGDTRAHDAAVFSVAVSPDGKWAASASWDKTIRLWRFTDQISQPLALVQTLTGFSSGMRAVKFSPDSERLFAWSPARQVQVWHMPDRERQDELYIGTAGGGLTATALVFSPDGSLTAALQNRQVRIFNTGDGTTLSTLKSFKTNVLAAALSGDGSLAATLETETLKLWQTDGGRLLAEIPLPEAVDAPALLTLSPDNRRLILLSESFWVWELPADWTAGEQLGIPENTPAGFLPALPFFTRFTPDGAGLFSALQDGRLYQAPLDQPFAARTGPRLTDNPAAMAAAPDLAWIAAASSDQRLLVWPAGSSEAHITSARYWRIPGTLAFSQAGTLVASSDGQGKLNIWDVEEGSVTETLNVPAGVSALAFSADDSLLAVISRDGIQLWQTADWSLLDSFSGTAAAFSPDGALLAAVAWDELQEVVFLRQVGPESTAVEQRIPVSGNALAFSPNGELLAASGKTLTILRTSDGKILLELDPPLPFGEPFFSPDGAYLALSHWDGTVSLWGIP